MLWISLNKLIAFQPAYNYNTALPVVKEEGGFLLEIISYNN